MRIEARDFLRYKEEAESLLRTIEEFPDIFFFGENAFGVGVYRRVIRASFLIK